MTDEEALDWLKSRKEHYELDDNCQELAEALNIGIKALENQKSIIEELEKIKSEILENHEIECYGKCNICVEMYCYDELGSVEANRLISDFKIIDNHIAELKGKNENG